jgi:hypothetical protein
MNKKPLGGLGVTWLVLLALAPLLAGEAKAGLGGTASPSVALAWNASASSDVTNYDVLYGVASGVLTEELAVGTNLSATVTGLIPGTTYFFAVVAVDINGNESAYSSETNYLASDLSCTVAISNLDQTYSGQPEPVTVTTVPASLAVNVTYNGSASVPVDAGSYTVIATVASATYAGAATNMLVISPALAVVTLANLQQTYNNAGNEVSVTTQPAGLTTVVTYNGLTNLPTGTGSYTVVGSIVGGNYIGSTTNTLLIEVAPQTITFNPIANQTSTNAPVQLTATASSGLAVIFAVVSGPATLNGSVLTLTGAGVVTVEATQSGNDDWSAAPSVEQSFNVSLAPVIAGQPASQAVLIGGEAVFSVTASGAPPLSYQWSFDGTNISGATSASLTLTDLQACQSGCYAVLVGNSFGSTLSSNAMLAVGSLPRISGQPASQSVESNCNATFSVSASSAQTVGYQWWYNDAALDAATNSSLAISGVQASNFGSYSVVLTNVFGATTSAVAVLALALPPQANPVTVLRFPQGGVRVNVSALTSNDTVAMYDSLTVIEVSTNSAEGGSVSLSGSWIYYTPPANGAASDTFTYTVSDGHCGTSMATVTVLPGASNPQPLNFAIANTGDGSVQLSFDGMPGGAYQIQCTASLSPASWQTLTNAPANSLGVFQISDSSAANLPMRFYRALWPQP